MPTLYTGPGSCSLSPNIAVAWLAPRNEADIRQARAGQDMESIG